MEQFLKERNALLVDKKQLYSQADVKAAQLAVGVNAAKSIYLKS